ncbi:MAG: AraC family transcriptional regulator [Roseibium sp.]|uniref:helix-turn-helix transcriptional regulator n=1 Tax=Roseibium sp. TaxID=1936156 RepID=UPI003D9C557C
MAAYEKSEQPWAKIGSQQVAAGDCFVDYVSKHSEGHVVSATAACLTLSATLSPSSGMFAANSDRLEELTRPQNASAFVPRGTTIKAAVSAGSQEMLLFHLRNPPEELVELNALGYGLEFRNDLVDANLGLLAREIRRALLTGQKEGPNFIEHLIYAFAQRQLYLMRSKPAPSLKCSPWISSTVVSKIKDYIDANVGQSLSLNDVASAVQIPLFRLQRELRATAGVSLYQLILSRRIARVRELLAFSDQTLADISFQCGFSSQQHMTSVFSSRLGVSPGRYRRETNADQNRKTQ